MEKHKDLPTPGFPAHVLHTFVYWILVCFVEVFPETYGANTKVRMKTNRAVIVAVARSVALESPIFSFLTFFIVIMGSQYLSLNPSTFHIIMPYKQRIVI